MRLNRLGRRRDPRIKSGGIQTLGLRRLSLDRFAVARDDEAGDSMGTRHDLAPPRFAGLAKRRSALALGDELQQSAAAVLRPHRAENSQSFVVAAHRRAVVGRRSWRRPHRHRVPGLAEVGSRRSAAVSASRRLLEHRGERCDRQKSVESRAQRKMRNHRRLHENVVCSVVRRRQTIELRIRSHRGEPTEEIRPSIKSI